MTTPEQIIRCIKSDMDGDLIAGADYCERISRNASMNPWAEAGDAHNYAEAARRLRDEHAEQQRLLSPIPNESSPLATLRASA